MYVLHYIILPRINAVLDMWNHHPMQTEKNWSPLRTWTNGRKDLCNNNCQHIAECQQKLHNEGDDLMWYGMDWYAPSPSDDGLSTVTVEEGDVLLSENDLLQLHIINSLENSDEFRIDLFVQEIGILII